MTRLTTFALLASFAIGSGAALAGTAIQTGTTGLGTVLTDGDGMTLYTFDKDLPAVSNCNGECAVKWPPLMATNAARPQDGFGIIIRADGARQWTFMGMPLYTWFKDTAPGDTTGDMVKGVWHVAKP